MNFKDESKLDNPVWYSLSESHKEYAIDYSGSKFYHPDYCPFGGFIDAETTSSAANNYSKLCQNFFIVGEKPVIPNNLKIIDELVCLQMIIYDTIDLQYTDEIVKLEEEHLDDLMGLVKIVYPEYFKEKTADIGSYYGIYINNQLVAMTGERMKMDGFTEVSAVITHPDHTGKGYAKQLVAYTANAILKENSIPFLHVYEKNYGAIKLYEKLGFKTRTRMSFWNITT
ncbi:GNAT family N-acetyltransferase [Flavobacterium sp. K5-23]|uniref:GNAT family N-acetyltransferase n=1 Tax=Flavobacterium sp. K5-23 TaxID=2746225 RepID=UPI00200C241A|nr:GNAT family N-acetyltransferase [Flavobacterium sp. K5-23]UQD57510.1 GNAT family N-acetyltransferase [Flavobacterium sp. K5-23]